MSTPKSLGIKSAMARLDRVRGALHGLLIADATAMPTHWYYGGVRQLNQDYGGPINSYVAPPLQQYDSVSHLPIPDTPVIQHLSDYGQVQHVRRWPRFVGGHCHR